MKWPAHYRIKKTKQKILRIEWIHNVQITIKVNIYNFERKNWGWREGSLSKAPAPQEGRPEFRSPSHIKTWVQSTHLLPWDGERGSGQRRIHDVHWPTSLADWMIFRFREKFCLKKQRCKEIKEDTWHQPLASMCLCTHMHAHTSAYTNTNKYICHVQATHYVPTHTEKFKSII